ncbi:MAG: hypothetical protein KDC09_03675 [Bacteroidales bacterium]|nr:hypothetical protein [Bacteroidales bacterium]
MQIAFLSYFKTEVKLMEKGMKSMELKNKLDELKNLILNEANDVINLSAIERDLALQKTRELYDLLLNYSAQAPPVENITAAIEPIEPVSAAIVEEEIQELETDTDEIENSEILSDENTSSNDLATEKQSSKPIVSEPDLFTSEAETKKEEPKTKSPAGAGAIGDMFSETMEKETIAEKIQKDKIKSLNVAIGINDKFYFINELFNGSLNDYSAAIENLDTSLNLNDANSRLEKLGSSFNWDTTAEAYLQLLSFVERKFI